ncbi:hypothetical protein SAY86_009406 [Trapa natans]|uniref:Uncharacterized protein n=1 Tax=Trapa natans TaxID=22666 RepID=A0AAN7L4E6_TRANT|nr:hypothetical protein SAY86_009406 [Trapa natans]
MGNLISHAANGIGDAVGSAFSAPFKSVFGASCDEVCAGSWDIVCFIEHLCVSKLVKFLLIAGLCYVVLVFFFLLFKLGICQCIGRSLCKMCWAACETYWHAVGDILCFFWRKLINTKRVYGGKRRSRDPEVGYRSLDDEEENVISRDHCHVGASNKRKLYREPESLSIGHSLRDLRVRRRRHVSLRVLGGSQRRRRLMNRHTRHHHHHHRHLKTTSKSCKRRKLG